MRETLEQDCLDPSSGPSTTAGVPNLQDLISDGADVIILEIKCKINVIYLNHPKTNPHPQSIEKLSSTKLVPDVKKFGDCCCTICKVLLKLLTSSALQIPHSSSVKLSRS